MASPIAILRAHPRLFIAAGVGIAALLLLPNSLAPQTRAVVAWDLLVTSFLILTAALFARQCPEHMPADAARQEEGEWTIFAITVAAVAASFAVIVFEFSATKDAHGLERSLRIGLVAFTLFASWLMTHLLFGLRYAHEFYSARPDGGGIDRGLEFPSELEPDYWDFVYFSLVLGMTFQVSDVQITTRKMRRLATVHGLLGFLFNTVVIALTVNIAASLLS
jgi:uncharacterized membrane protein